MSKKNVKITGKDFDIVDGKVIIKDEELNTLITEATYDLNSEPGDNAITLSVTKD